MRCPIETQENAELLLSYSARRLSPENAAALEAHMEACPACREFRDSQSALWETLDRWEAWPVSLDFDRRFANKYFADVSPEKRLYRLRQFRYEHKADIRAAVKELQECVRH